MKTLFFCENANQVHLSRALSPHMPPTSEAEILLLDWQRDTTEWVLGAARRLRWGVPTTNLFDRIPGYLQEEIRTTTKRAELLRDAAFDQLRPYIDRRDVWLVQYNDTSQRGRAVAHVARNLGIRRLLVQDGFLNFVSKSGNLATSDQNYRWGHSHPERVAVWGESMARQLVERHDVSRASILVTGPVRSDLVPPRTTKLAPLPEHPQVLWADQAILDQRKARREDWLEEYAELGDALSDFATELRLHPSTRDRTRNDLMEALGGRITVSTPSGPLDDATIGRFDVVVTYYSTVFLDCLRHEIPCIVYRARSLDIELPDIDHPLLTYCDTPEQVRDAIRRLRNTPLEEVATPKDIFEFVRADPDVGVLRGELSWDARPQPQLTAVPTSFPARMALRRLRDRQVLVWGGSFGDHIGVGKPIKALVSSLSGSGVDFRYLLGSGGSVQYLLEQVQRADLLLINSFEIAKLVAPSVLTSVVKTCQERGTPIVFYAHETAYVFDVLRKNYPHRVARFVSSVLPTSLCLAVSDAQAAWLAALGARHVRVVYNTIAAPLAPQKSTHGLAGGSDDPSSRPETVVMVGTQQPRKGLDLFSEVADRSRAAGHSWRFIWIGGPTTAGASCYRSPAVEWRGHLPPSSVLEELAAASVLLLSSVDDPLPLSVGEALAAGTKCVVYRETGFADFISDTGAGQVYDFYDSESAMRALEQALASETAVDPTDVLELVSIERFAERMLSALGDAMFAHQVQAPPDASSGDQGGPPPSQVRAALKRLGLGRLRRAVPRARR